MKYPVAKFTRSYLTYDPESEMRTAYDQAYENLCEMVELWCAEHGIQLTVRHGDIHCDQLDCDVTVVWLTAHTETDYAMLKILLPDSNVATSITRPNGDWIFSNWYKPSETWWMTDIHEQIPENTRNLLTDIDDTSIIVA